MSARERRPVRPSANGSGPDPADGSKGDATVADSTQVDTPDMEAAGAVDVPVLDHNGSAAAGEDREIVATTDDRENGDSPDGQPDADQPDGQAEVDEPGGTADVDQVAADEPGADEPGADQAADQPDTRQAEHQVDAGQPDDDASVAEAERDPSTDDTTVPDVEAPAEPVPVATVESAETVDQTEDKTPDPIEIANRFAAEVPEPASVFVRPDKAPASSPVVPEQVPMEMPVLAPVDEAT
ncbi:MAG TPA: hypothetical protein VKE25_07810, partial [Actinomycetes bacterium]|nr:hypothetical protein [Actinomycetes bacterium]